MSGPKKADNDQAESRESIEAAIRSAAEVFDTPFQAVIGTTLAGTIVYWNGAAERMYGWTAEEVVGRDVVKVTPSNLTVAVAEEIMERLAGGHSWSGEFQVRNRAGDEFLVEVRDLPVVGLDGTLIGIVGTSNPI